MIDLDRSVVEVDVGPRPGEVGDLFPLRGPTPLGLLVVVTALLLPMFSFPVARGILGYTFFETFCVFVGYQSGLYMQQQKSDGEGLDRGCVWRAKSGILAYPKAKSN